MGGGREMGRGMGPCPAAAGCLDGWLAGPREACCRPAAATPCGAALAAPTACSSAESCSEEGSSEPVGSCCLKTAPSCAGPACAPKGSGCC